MRTREPTCCRSLGIFSGHAELGPGLALCHAGVDDFAVCGEAYPAGGLDLLAVIIESPCHDGLGSVLVEGLGVRGELVGGIIEVLIIGPVRATVYMLERRSRRARSSEGALLC